MPLLDIVEFLFSIAFIAAGLLFQDTWLSHFSILITFNGAPALIKLIACPPVFTVGAPDPKTNKVTEWPLKCYYQARVVAVSFLFWAIIVQEVLSTYAIADKTFYDDFTYGLCSFCY